MIRKVFTKEYEVVAISVIGSEESSVTFAESTAFQFVKDDSIVIEVGYVYDGFTYIRPIATNPPVFDKLTQEVVLDGCEIINGQWQYKWKTNNLTQEQISAKYKASLPQSVTMRQARLALLSANLLSSIDTTIASLPSPQKEAATIEWEYSQEVQRHNGLISVLAPVLQLTEQQIDELFILAATL